MPQPNARPPATLFSRPERSAAASLDKALAATAGAFPLSRSRLGELPAAVRDLSHLLTRGRGPGLARSYWAAPRFVAAYMRYFLPWNLFRLLHLLPGLPLPLPPGARLLDLGSGPLTLPLALWCARPDLRSRPLDIVCCDVSPKIMATGLTAFHLLAGEDAPWRFTLERAPLEKALAAARGGAFDCVCAGNVLNELAAGPEGGDSALADRLEGLAARMDAALAPHGRIFLTEPGTRLGGRLIALARRAALDRGFSAFAPCTHDGPCPLLEGERGRAGGWCHFSLSAKGAPEALTALAKAAGLEKERLTLSCLLLRKTAAEGGGGAEGQSRARLPGAAGDELAELEALYEEIMAGDGPESGPGKKARFSGGGAEGAGGSGRRSLAAGTGPARPGAQAAGSARVVSGPIRLPGGGQSARYVCCERGLGLLADADGMPSGALVRVLFPEPPRRDRKSGALMLRRA